jgi:hypothetical protein
VQILHAGMHSWTAKQQMTEVLALICRYTPATLSALAAHVPDVVVALVERTFEADFPEGVKLGMRYSCLNCLVQLSQSMEGKAAVREAGAVPILANLLKEKDSTTISKTLSAFMALSIDTESKYVILQVRGRFSAGGNVYLP